jgi:Holliday junction resolvase RusA-like endonuclease
MQPAQRPASFLISEAGGEAVLELPLRPVSSQAKSAEKEEYRETIRKLIASKDVILLNDVTIDVKWHVEERARYEGDSTPDVDNILKPLLDGVSGPKGLLINDCQVQAIGSYWVDEYYDSQSLEIRFTFERDFAISRKSLVFVRIEDQVFIPMDDSLGPIELLAILDFLEFQFKARAELFKLGHGYRTARRVMPSQRVYHRTRIEGFRFYEMEEYRTLVGGRKA